MKKIFFLLCFALAGCAAVVSPETEVAQTLGAMNQAYRDKDADGFMAFISPEYRGDRDEFQIAVENDFAGFAQVDCRMSVFQVLIDPETGIYTASVYYSRTARSSRFGTDNRGGDAVLTFTKDENGLRVIEMSSPAPYGLINP